VRRAREACLRGVYKGLCERRVKKRVSDIRLRVLQATRRNKKGKKENNKIQHAVNKMLK
jgi:hypothetical protein